MNRRIKKKVAKAVRDPEAGGRNYLSPAAPDSSRVWREVDADAVGKGVCVYTQRLYEGYDKLYHQTSGRDVYGRSDC